MLSPNICTRRCGYLAAGVVLAAVGSAHLELVAIALVVTALVYSPGNELLGSSSTSAA